MCVGGVGGGIYAFPVVYALIWPCVDMALCSVCTHIWPCVVYALTYGLV